MNRFQAVKRAWIAAVLASTGICGCEDPKKNADADADARSGALANASTHAHPNADADANANADAEANVNADASANADADVDADTNADAGTDGGSNPFVTYKKILHVGDSTVGYTTGLQMELKRMFKDAGIAYVSWTVTSAGIHAFAEDRVVEKMVKRHSPDLVIVQLGTNNLTVPRPDVYVVDIKNILSQVGARSCYWIGPISIKFPERGMRGILRDNVSPCVFYDSYDLTLERQPDGLHPSQSASKIWAEAFWAFAGQNPASALR
jgi:hypothetical protein